MKRGTLIALGLSAVTALLVASRRSPKKAGDGTNVDERPDEIKKADPGSVTAPPAPTGTTFPSIPPGTSLLDEYNAIIGSGPRSLAYAHPEQISLPALENLADRLFRADLVEQAARTKETYERLAYSQTRATLLQEYNALIGSGTSSLTYAHPEQVRLSQLSALATALDKFGMPNEAVLTRDTIRRLLLREFTSMEALAYAHPERVELAIIDTLAQRLEDNNLKAEASQLRSTSSRLWSSRNIQTGAPPPGGPPLGGMRGE